MLNLVVIVADGITTFWLMLLPVVVADGITTYWLMLLPIWLMVLPYVCVGWSRQML